MNFIMSFLNGEGTLNRLQFFSRLLILSVVFFITVILLTMVGCDPIKADLILFPFHLALIYPLVKARINSLGYNPKLAWIWTLGFLVIGINLILICILLFKAPLREARVPDRFISPSLLVGILFSLIVAYSGIV